MQDLDVVFRLQNVRCLDEADGPGDAEPYRWVVYFKIDGETVTADAAGRLHGHATVETRAGDHGDLHDDSVSAGDLVPIPAALNRFDTLLQPIRMTLDSGAVLEAGGVVGCIVVLLEDDGVPNDAIRAGHRKLDEVVRLELDRLIAEELSATRPTLDRAVIDALVARVSRKVTDAVSDALGLGGTVRVLIQFGNTDDVVGGAVLMASHEHLALAGPAGFQLRQRWNQTFAFVEQVPSGPLSLAIPLPPGRYDAPLPGFNWVRLPAGWRLLTFDRPSFDGLSQVVTGNATIATGFQSFIIDQGEVLLFEAPDFAGSRQTLGEPIRIPSFGAGDNRLASLRVPPDWRVTLFSEPNWQGDRVVIDRDTARLPGLLAGRVSSLVAERFDGGSGDGDWEISAHVVATPRRTVPHPIPVIDVTLSHG